MTKTTVSKYETTSNSICVVCVT